jgi:heat shock protein HslJ
MSYQERDTQVDDRGIWELAGDGKTLVLRGRGGETQKFALRDRDTLRKLDQAGEEIVSQLNYDLKRAPTFSPLEPNVASASLENTYWKLTRLRDSAISTSAKNEPHLILDSETRQVSGSSGCNRLVGSYTLDGDRLTFTHTAGTMMACLDGMDTEKALLQALQQVSSWKIRVQHLSCLIPTASKSRALKRAPRCKLPLSQQDEDFETTGLEHCRTYTRRSAVAH